MKRKTYHLYQKKEEATSNLRKAQDSLVNLIVLPGSELVGETIVSASFREKYDISVLAIRKKGEQFNKRLNDVVLKPGDALLVQTTDKTIETLVSHNDVAVAQGTEKPSYDPKKSRWAATILLEVVTLAAFDILPIVMAAFAGIVGMTLTGCISPQKAYNSVDWRVISSCKYNAVRNSARKQWYSTTYSKRSDNNWKLLTTISHTYRSFRDSQHPGQRSKCQRHSGSDGTDFHKDSSEPWC